MEARNVLSFSFLTNAYYFESNGNITHHTGRSLVAALYI